MSAPENKIKSPEELVLELQSNRDELHDMLGDVSKLRKQLEKIIPDTFDFRNRRVLDEKLKTIGSIINTELDIRKQIDFSVKTQAELGKKNTEASNLNVNLIRQYAEQLDEMEDGQDYSGHLQ